MNENCEALAKWAEPPRRRGNQSKGRGLLLRTAWFGGGLVFLDAGEAPDGRIDKEVGVVVGGGHLADDAVAGFGSELVVNAGRQGARGCAVRAGRTSLSRSIRAPRPG